MHYTQDDFIDTADQAKLDWIAQARKLTRMYYDSDYMAGEERRSILLELLGGIGENVAIDTPFHCNYGKKYLYWRPCDHQYELYVCR